MISKEQIEDGAALRSIPRRFQPAVAGSAECGASVLREAPIVARYYQHITTMEADPTQAYNQEDATGFIRLNALRLHVAATVQRKK